MDICLVKGGGEDRFGIPGGGYIIDGNGGWVKADELGKTDVGIGGGGTLYMCASVTSDESSTGGGGGGGGGSSCAGKINGNGTPR